MGQVVPLCDMLKFTADPYPANCVIEPVGCAAATRRNGYYEP